MVNATAMTKSKLAIFLTTACLVALGVTIFPIRFSLGVMAFVFGSAAIYLSYRCPEFFLILALSTYFLKFTFIFSVFGLGITPFMIFEGLTLAGYGLRILTGKDQIRLPVGYGFLLAFIILTSMSLVLVHDYESALGLYFRALLDWMLMLFLVQMITDRRRLKVLMGALVIQALAIITWGMVDSYQAWASGVNLLTSYDSFFWNQFRKNDFAVYLAFVTLLSLMIVLREKNRLRRSVAALILIIIPLAWFVTRSRSGLLAIVMSLVIFLVLERNAKLLRLLFVFSIIVLVTFSIVPSQGRDIILDGFRALVDPDSVVYERNTYTINLRLQLMEAGLAKIVDNPLLGLGYSQWQFHSPFSVYRTDPRTGDIYLDPLEIHSRHFQIAVNNGLPALAAYISFVATILYASFRARRNTRGVILSFINVLVAFIISGQITMFFITGFLWEWPAFGILAGLINLVEAESIGRITKYRMFAIR